MPTPNIQPSEPRPGNPNQPPVTIAPNEPADTLAKALANGKKQIDATK
jgi:hypothetical protein